MFYFLLNEKGSYINCQFMKDLTNCKSLNNTSLCIKNGIKI